MIAIGGSLGGCEALCEILQRLPADFALPIAVVLHRHRDSDGLLLPVVQRNSLLPVCEAEDKDPIEPGRVYLCPPDYHLLVEGSCFSLSTDEPVLFARPSIDVFFESAAEWKGRQLIAVVLSGAGSDGAEGARRVLAAGGQVFVQQPTTAQGHWMPAAAIAATGTPHIFPLPELADRLATLARSPRARLDPGRPG